MYEGPCIIYIYVCVRVCVHVSRSMYIRFVLLLYMYIAYMTEARMFPPSILMTCLKLNAA